MFLFELFIINGFFLIQQPLLIAQRLFINHNLLEIVAKCPFGFILYFVVDTTIDCLGVLIYFFISINCCNNLFVIDIWPRLVDFFLNFCCSQFFTVIIVLLFQMRYTIFCIFFLFLWIFEIGINYRLEITLMWLILFGLLLQHFHLKLFILSLKILLELLLKLFPLPLILSICRDSIKEK